MQSREPNPQISVIIPACNAEETIAQCLKSLAQQTVSRERYEIIIIDEIGKMECFSEKFCQAAINALNAGNVVLGTIAVGGTDFIREIKERKDIKIFEVMVQNRDVLPEQLIEEIEWFFKKRKNP